jgi:hypothetical protein
MTFNAWRQGRQPFPQGEASMKKSMGKPQNKRARQALRTTALAALISYAALAQATVVNVSDMIASQWTQTNLFTSGTQFTQTLTNPATGGNPGSFWQHRVDIAANNVGLNQFRQALVFNGAQYDPGTEGALASLAFSFDTIRILSPFSDGSAGSLLALLEQGGRFFTRTLGAASVTSSGWQTHTVSSSLASEWVELNTLATPDFSANGDTLHFGYRVSLGALCPAASVCSGVTVISGLDNFRVEALAAVAPNTVPEPGSLLLALAALAGIRVVNRRKTAHQQQSV